MWRALKVVYDVSQYVQERNHTSNYRFCFYVFMYLGLCGALAWNRGHIFSIQDLTVCYCLFSNTLKYSYFVNSSSICE
jgi:hypothetical protein